MSILVSVVNQRLRIPANLKNYVDGSQNFVKFSFDLSDEWDGLLIFAQFTQGGQSYNIYLDDNNCVYLPPEITAGTCSMMLYGTGNNIIATTGTVELHIDKNKFISDASSVEITETLYDQLSSRYIELSGRYIELSGRYIELSEWKTSIEDDAPLHWIDL